MPDPSQLTLELQIDATGAAVVVRLAGELDTETSARFLEALERTLAAGEAQQLELDLSGLTFLDVAGARALVRVHDEVTSVGGRVRVAGLDEDRLPAARVLDLGRYLHARSAEGHESG
jgi:anti-anti-sigma factor